MKTHSRSEAETPLYRATYQAAAVGTSASRSSKPSAKCGGVPRAMKNGNNGKNVILGGEVYAVCFESFQAYFPCPATNLAKNIRLGTSTFQHLIDLPGKFFAQTRTFILIPGNGLREFSPGGGLKNERAVHHQPKRRRISALTCSNGTPARGFFSKSASRRSNSAACSGVNSSSKSPNSSQTFSATSYCSAGGSRRICSNISDALMTLIYPVGASVQAEFSDRAWKCPAL